MQDLIRLPVSFEVAPLLDEVALVAPEEWIEHYRADDFEGAWDVAPLHSVGGDPTLLYATPTPNIYHPTPLVERCPALAAVIASIPAVTHAVRLMRLGPSSRILEHGDSATSIADGTIRLHVPITTDEQVDFLIGGERVDMRPGECWYANFNLLHSVDNRGDRPRIHLVIDCDIGPELQRLLEAGTNPTLRD